MTIVEQLKKLLPDVQISDDFEIKIQEVFNESIKERTQIIEKEFEERFKEVVEKANAYAEYVKEETNPEEIIRIANEYAGYVVDYISGKVDAYCDHIVEEFISEHEAMLIETHEFNRVVETLRTIKEAFETNFFALSEDTPNNKLVNELKETTTAYNTLFNKHTELQEQVEKYSLYIDECNRENIFERLTRDLAESQKDKLRTLVEKTQFETIENFEEGVKLMIKEFHSKNIEGENVSEKGDRLTEDTQMPEVDDRMKAYLKSL